MAIGNVQTVNTPSVINNSSMTVASTGAHHLIVVTISINNNTDTVTGLTWLTGNGGTFVQVPGARATDASGIATDIWYIKDSLSGGTAYEVNMSTGVPTMGITFYEFSGTDLGNVDQVNSFSNQAAAANPTGPSITTGTSGEAVLSILGPQTSVTAVAGGFALNQTDGSGAGHANDITTTSGTFSPAWTSTSGTYCGSTASFKPAGGALLISTDFAPGAGGMALPQPTAVAS